MKSKLLFIKSCFGILFFLSFIVGCKNKTEPNISSPKGDFNGLYTIEYENSDIQYVWIFSDNIRYVLYPGSTSNYLNANKSINYEKPTHYYVTGNKFYTCGIDINMNAVPLIECKNKKSEPRYNIVSIDTIEDTYFKDKYQEIILEEYNSENQIKLKRGL